MEKYVFDADEFKDGFDDYVIENEYYDYDTIYDNEMKDPEFAKEVYDFLESELSSWEFKDFIKLRENRNDGYTPTTELEQGKEK